MTNKNTLPDASLSKLMQSVMENYQHWLEIDVEYVPLQELVGRRVKEFAGKCTDQTLFVFEGGCGTGITSEIILEANPSITLYAVDNDEEMIKIARSRLPRVYNGRWIAQVDDFLSGLGCVGQVDIIVSTLTVHNMSKEHRQELLHKVSSKLRPGGLFINGDKIVLDNNQEYEKAFQLWIARLEKFKQKGLDYIYDSYYAHELADRENKLTETEQKNIVEGAGLTWQGIERIGMYAVATAIKPES